MRRSHRRSDHMESPTWALHLTRVTLSLRQLGAEPHTKGVGRGEVYDRHCLRSARGDDGSRGAIARTADPGASHVELRFRNDPALRRTPAPRLRHALLLPSRAVRLRAAARAHDASIPCDVIAPALIPRHPGDRVKTDGRDAGQLAALYRAGALTAFHIPTEMEEAARDLLRRREDIRVDRRRARHRLAKFLLRHGRRFTATKTAWTKRHAAWLEAQHWPLPRSSKPIVPTCARSRKPSASCWRQYRTPGPPHHRTPAIPRRAPALFPRHRRPHRPDHRSRARRHAPLSGSAAGHGLYRARPVRTLRRRQTRPRRDYQNRQRPLAPRARRIRVALQAPPVPRSLASPNRLAEIRIGMTRHSPLSAGFDRSQSGTKSRSVSIQFARRLQDEPATGLPSQSMAMCDLRFVIGNHESRMVSPSSVAGRRGLSRHPYTQAVPTHRWR